MHTRFSEDIIPLSDWKVNPGKVVNHAKDTHRPVLLTSRGRGVALVQGLEEFEENAEKLAFVKAIAQAVMDIKDGKTVQLGEVSKRLGTISLSLCLSTFKHCRSTLILDEFFLSLTNSISVKLFIRLAVWRTYAIQNLYK